MDPNMQKALSNPQSWKKGAEMLLFFLILAVVTPLLMLISLVGWVFLLFRGQEPESIRVFGRSLAAWYAQTARYLTGDARRRPFPFEDLDCPTDEPPVTVTAEEFQGSPGQVSKPVTRPTGQAQAAAVSPGTTAAKNAPIKKAGSKKAGSKKAAKKKAGSRKAVSKKVDSKTVDSKTVGENQSTTEATSGPAAPGGDQES